jgi:hypothetical protein
MLGLTARAKNTAFTETKFAEAVGGCKRHSCMTFAQNLKHIFITFSRLYFWQALGPTRIPQHSDARAIPGRAARHDAKQKIGSNF